MALVTTAGTETLHSHLFKNVDGAQTLIYGVQHHIYTVLSIIVFCHVLNATTDTGTIRLFGYDNHGEGSPTGQEVFIARFNIQVGETFVWNDKFSFNGFEPSGTGIFSPAVQILNAAQGGSADQELQFTQSSSVDNFDITVTYIDQNNA